MDDYSDHNQGITRRQLLASLFATTAFCSLPAAARSNAASVSLTFGQAARDPVPLDYVGFSYESAQLADPDFFAEDNAELISLFRSLSDHGVLRIGGNSSEFCWWKAGPDDRPPQFPASAHEMKTGCPTPSLREAVAIDRLEVPLSHRMECIYGLNLGVGALNGTRQRRSMSRKGSVPACSISRSATSLSLPGRQQPVRPPEWDFDKYLAQWITFARARSRGCRISGLAGPMSGRTRRGWCASPRKHRNSSRARSLPLPATITPRARRIVRILPWLDSWPRTPELIAMCPESLPRPTNRMSFTA